MASTLGEQIEQAVTDRRLMETTGANIAALLEGADTPLYAQVVAELVAWEKWDELNDRFLQDAGVRHGRAARADDRESRDAFRARVGGGRCAAGVSLRGHERDELLQHRACDSRACRLLCATGLRASG
jgi:hypothetical protein